MKIEITSDDITPYLTIGNNDIEVFYDNVFIVRDISWNRYKNIYEKHYKAITINGKTVKSKSSFEMLLLDIMSKAGYVYVDNEEECGFERRLEDETNIL